MTARRSVVLGCGSYLPSHVMTNADLAGKVDTSDEWIVQRTGIHERRIAAPGEVTSQLATHAARAALAHAHVDAESIDLIVLATSTPDNTFPASAVSVQADLGITHGAAFDLQAVCSGFVYALATADGLLRSGAFSRALVIGAETFSRILDWSDRGTCVLFGDGAGAVVLDAQEQAGTREDRGILTVRLRSDGRHKMKLYVDGGPSSTRTVGHLRMEGREVFRHAVAMITDVVEDAFKATGYSADDIDWFIPHQANKRIIDGSAHKLGIAPGKDRHHGRSARQHVGGFDTARACRCGGRPAHQARRPAVARGDGRRLHLGRRTRALVSKQQPLFTRDVDRSPLPREALISLIIQHDTLDMIKHRSAEGLAMAGKTVTRADLCEAVYQKVGLSRTESATLVELVLKEITDCLERGETVKLSSFGSFVVRKKGQRIGRNPKTGKEVPISPRRVMVFKPSAILKQRINSEPDGSGGGGQVTTRDDRVTHQGAGGIGKSAGRIPHDQRSGRGARCAAARAALLGKPLSRKSGR